LSNQELIRSSILIARMYERFFFEASFFE